MLAWISENLGTILVLLVLVLIVGGIIFSMIKKRKNGGSSCGCGCEHCAMHGACHKHGEP